MWGAARMLYFTAVGLIGVACAMAFRWPVMFVLAALVVVSCFVVQLEQGAPASVAAMHAVASSLVLQLCYVVGGFLLTVRVRGLSAKKNLEV